MSGRLFPRSLSRCISDVSREIQMLTSPHSPPPPPETQTMSPLHLPDVREPAQYLMDMGLRPALTHRLLNIYMDFVARYKQVFESYFRRAIQWGCDSQDHYRDLFVVQFKGTIQVLESQFTSAAWVWLCRTGYPPTHFRPQCIDVRGPVNTTLSRS